ncbi:MAG: mreC: rod shape-determining protein MreC [Firmicutes bacterium]|nr:mreC: rod shape-determining protein MreC [Bacillota bacterium]
MRWFDKKTVVLCVAFVTVFLLVISAARLQNRYPLMAGIAAAVMAPFDYVFSGIAGGIQQGTVFTRDVATVYRENQTLRSENQELRHVVFQLTEKAAENERLQAMLEFRTKSVAFQMKAATVIGRDPGILNYSILINQGANDGLKINMPVVTHQGLVGHVMETFAGTAKVRLLVDTGSSAASMVQRPQSRAVGIVEGNPSQVSVLRMKNLMRDGDVIKGDKIMTSGLGGIYPKGLLIGEVTDVVDDDGGLLKTALIRPALDFSRLEEVFVIIGERAPARP